MNIHFTKDAWITNKHMKRCSTLAALGNKNPRILPHTFRTPKTKKSILPSVGEDVEELDLSYTAGGDAK